MTTARRFLPSDPADFARSLVPLALLALAAALHDARFVVVVVLMAGTGVAIGRDAPVRWAWAAAIPVSVSLAWGAWLLPSPATTAVSSSCADPASPLAVWRFAEAVVVLGILAALALLLGSSATQLGLRMPARRYVRWAVIGFLVAGPVALLMGPLLARPFFGEIDYDITVVGAIVPALLFAVANGTMEEIAYRGALLGWSARVMGVGPALVGQAIVFGLAHSGPDVVGSPIPLMVALGVGGLLAGVIAIRTRSLLIPIAVHIGVDIPIYYGLACAT